MKFKNVWILVAVVVLLKGFECNDFKCTRDCTLKFSPTSCWTKTFNFFTNQIVKDALNYFKAYGPIDNNENSTELIENIKVYQNETFNERLEEFLGLFPDTQDKLINTQKLEYAKETANQLMLDILSFFQNELDFSDLSAAPDVSCPPKCPETEDKESLYMKLTITCFALTIAMSLVFLLISIRIEKKIVQLSKID